MSEHPQRSVEGSGKSKPRSRGRTSQAANGATLAEEFLAMRTRSILLAGTVLAMAAGGGALA